jgi:hypothetical protein
LSEAARQADAVNHARKLEPADLAAVPVPPQQVDSGLITLTADDVDILSSLFRERASLIPRRALSGETINLLRRLRLVD